MTSLHLGNQFMYHMIISGNCWAFFFNVFFIYSFSPLTAVRRDEDKKWNKNSRSTVEFMFSLIRSRRLDINLGLFIRFMDLDFVSVDENATKELSQYLVILTSHSVNIVYEYISCRPIKIWQGKTVQEIVVLPSPEFVQRIGQWTSFPCNLVHKVLTSALITQIYRQNLLH